MNGTLQPVRECSGEPFPGEPADEDPGITHFGAAVSFEHAGERIDLVRVDVDLRSPGGTERALRVVDGAVLVLGRESVTCHEELLWRTAAMPCLVFVDGIGRGGTDLGAVTDGIRERLGVAPLVVQRPVLRDGHLVGLVDLVTMRRHSWDGGVVRDDTADDPESLAARRLLEEQVAEIHLGALEEFGDVTEKTLRAALREVTLTCAGVVVLGGSTWPGQGVGGSPRPGRRVGGSPRPGQGVGGSAWPGQGVGGSTWPGQGVGALLDAVVEFLPPPAGDPEAALATTVFKVKDDVTWVRVEQGTLAGPVLRLGPRGYAELNRAEAGDVVGLAGVRETPRSGRPVTVRIPFEARDDADEARLAAALATLLADDPDLTGGVDPATGWSVLSGIDPWQVRAAVGGLRAWTGRLRVIPPAPSAPPTPPNPPAPPTPSTASTPSARLGEQGRDHHHRGASTASTAFTASTALAASTPSAPSTASTATTPSAASVASAVTTPSAASAASAASAVTTPSAASAASAASAVTTPSAASALEITVIAPAEEIGGIVVDLAERGGEVTALSERQVTAVVPMAALLDFDNVLRSRTSGRAAFTSHPAT
ncbi:hypothetical protein GCM10009828_019780 [Actinoplanes couchii]